MSEMGIWPAPRTHAEFMRLFNPYRRWVVAFTVEVLSGEMKPLAVPPEGWPSYWWRDCDCAALTGGKE